MVTTLFPKYDTMNMRNILPMNHTEEKDMTTSTKTRFLRFFSIFLTVSAFGTALVDLLLKDNVGEQGKSNLFSFLLSPVVVACIFLGLLLTVLYRCLSKRTLLLMVLALLAVDGFLCGRAMVNIIANACWEYWRYGHFAFRNHAYLVFELTAMIAIVLLLVTLAKIVRGSKKRLLPVTASILYGMIGVAYAFSREMAVNVSLNFYSVIGVFPRILLGAALAVYFLHDKQTAIFSVQTEKKSAGDFLKTRYLRLFCILLTVSSVCAMLVFCYSQKDMAGLPAHELRLTLSFFLFPQTAAQVLFVLALTAWYRDKAKKRALLSVVVTLLAMLTYSGGLLFNSMEAIAITVMLFIALASFARGSERRVFPVTASILYGVLVMGGALSALALSCIFLGAALTLYFLFEERESPAASPSEI